MRTTFFFFALNIKGSYVLDHVALSQIPCVTSIMKVLSLNILLFLASTSGAIPVSGTNEFSSSYGTKPAAWNAGTVTQFPIHSSCNATQRRQIEMGLSETVLIAAHARDHILRWRNESEIYRKYFRDSPSMEALGAYDTVIDGNKSNVLFRCDDPDGNCNIEGM